MKFQQTKYIEKLHASLENYSFNKAIITESNEYTYAQLRSKVAWIQSLLLSKTDDFDRHRVGVVTNNDFSTYASIIACWFSGMSYIPLNPQFPEERNLGIIKKAGIDLVLNSQAGVISFLDNTDGLIIVDTSGGSGWVGELALSNAIDEKTELYVLFTSGSTGVPKGVPINVRNLNSFLDGLFDQEFNIIPEDVFLQMFELTFDVSIASFLIPLLCGASFCLPGNKGVRYLEILKILKQKKVTIASIVPSLINLLRPYLDQISLPDMRICILTAEASVKTEVSLFKKCIPNADIYNFYGPTEATIWCTACKIDEFTREYNGMLSIGKPFRNVGISIHDENGILLPDGEKGEMYLSGDQITIGYLNDENMNARCFQHIGAMIYYKTGDLCIHNSDGSVSYCGRLDSQVKVQGYRIELSEIEILVRTKTNCMNAALVSKDAYGNNKILLFIENYLGSEDDLWNLIKKALPSYMVPSQIIQLDQFPLNSSGKLDRRKLSNML